jgi:hypothetical protein
VGSPIFIDFSELIDYSERAINNIAIHSPLQIIFMFYENYLEQEPELMFEENQEVEEFEDDYRQDRIEEMVTRFGGY